MISDHTEGKIDLAVVAISASENQPDGGASPNYAVFEEKLKAAGLDHLEQLLPMAYWDVAFWDHALWDGDSELEKKIHDVLFPGEPIEKPQEEEFPEKKWRNHKCDVQVAWSHVLHGRDILVTRDSNFHKKAAALEHAGLKRIIRPHEYDP